MTDPLDVLRDLYKRKFGAAADSLVPVRAEGSNRRIYRLSGPKGAAIGVLNDDAKENRAFIEFSKHFFKNGIPVPEFYGENADCTAYLEQDLGDTTLFQFLGKKRTPQGFPPDVVAAYRDVVAWLPKIAIVAGKTIDEAWCYPRQSFDKQSMLWDLNYFKYYFLTLGGVPFHEERLEDDFQVFAGYLLAADRNYFLCRDFQSRNVMLHEGKPYFIDYQGGRRGALQYDIASLLYDAKADVPFALRDELLDLYITEANKYAKIDRDEFKKFFPGFVLIRIMQAMGADAQQIKFSELYVALQQGVVDGQENPLTNIASAKLYEVQKYISLTGHKYESTPFLMSKRTWDRMKPEDQKVVTDAAAEATQLQRQLNKEIDDKLVTELKGKGVQVDTVDRAAFMEAAKPVYTKWLASPIGAFVGRVQQAAR